MPTPITIILYSIEESLAKLAELRGRLKPYTRQGFADATKKALGSQAVQGKLWWTEDELRQVARRIRGVGRPRNT